MFITYQDIRQIPYKIPHKKIWKEHKRNVGIKQTRLRINLLKSDISLPSLICRGVGDLRKPHCGSHASDPIYNPMKIAIVRP